MNYLRRDAKSCVSLEIFFPNILLHEIMIHLPLHWIIDYVLPNLSKRFFISNDVIVISRLPGEIDVDILSCFRDSYLPAADHRPYIPGLRKWSGIARQHSSAALPKVDPIV